MKYIAAPDLHTARLIISDLYARSDAARRAAWQAAAVQYALGNNTVGPWYNGQQPPAEGATSYHAGLGTWWWCYVEPRGVAAYALDSGRGYLVAVSGEAQSHVGADVDAPAVADNDITAAWERGNLKQSHPGRVQVVTAAQAGLAVRSVLGHDVAGARMARSRAYKVPVSELKDSSQLVGPWAAKAAAVESGAGKGSRVDVIRR